MQPLTTSDLFAGGRRTSDLVEAATHANEHRRLRSLSLGPAAHLFFEDRLTVRHQLQVLVDETTPDAEWISEKLCAGNRMLPGPSELTASLVFHDSQATDPTIRNAIARRLYVEVEGLGRTAARHFEHPLQPSDADASSIHLVNFQLGPDQIAAMQIGADFGFGIDDDRMRVGAQPKGPCRRALLADLQAD